jgi:hypothetical protein
MRESHALQQQQQQQQRQQQQQQNWILRKTDQRRACSLQNKYLQNFVDQISTTTTTTTATTTLDT